MEPSRSSRISRAASPMRSRYSARSSRDISSPRRGSASAKPSTMVSGVRSAWESGRRRSSASALPVVIVVADLDLAALEGERDRVHAVSRLQLSDDVAHVRADGLDRHVQFVRDRLGRQPLGHEVHDLPLARREGGHLGRRARREQDAVEARVDVRAALGDALDGADELGHRSGLEGVAAGARVEAVVELLGVAVAGVEDDAEIGLAGEQRPRQLDAAPVRELDIDDRDVGHGVLDEVEPRGDVAGGAQDLHPLALQQRREALTHGLVVVDDDELRHAAHHIPVSKRRKERPDFACSGRLPAARLYRGGTMAKDTEKLIRQLSLISYLMAERRPVTALEIRRDVEGYSGMNEDAFARRFYADRSELESLGIHLTVDKPIDGVAEQENYSLRPENFHLSAIAFTDEELASLQFALTLLDGEFAYAEPLRLALQQISWGRPSPLHAPDQRGLALGITGSAGGHDLSQRLAKIETAIFRQKTITFDYYTMERDDLGARKVDPYHLLFRGGQFYVLGRSHERDALRVFRLSRIQGKVAYATKAEHDFKRPKDFDPREYANRADWQYGEPIGTAEVWISERIAWLVERHYGRFGSFAPAQDGVLFSTTYASARQLACWALSLGEHAAVEGPADLVEVVAERVARLAELHEAEPLLAAAVASAPAEELPDDPVEGNGRRESAIRPERFARLVTLASILIEAGRAGERLREEGVCERLQITGAELREDVSVLNVVNFGGGSYVLYAEVGDDGWIEVDPEPYSDNFARPARLLPVEAKALVAAIDLIGEHLPEGALASAREKIVAALGADPMEQGLHVAHAGADDSVVARVVSQAIADRHLIELEYYRPDKDEFSRRTVEPYALVNGREGWYVATFDPRKDDVRHFRLDRIKEVEVLPDRYEPRPEVDPAADVDGWQRTGELESSRVARVWVSPERARWEREARTVAEELADGSIVVEVPFKGTDWLVREVLREAGDAVVLEPEDARAAVAREAGRLRGAPVGAR